VKEARFPRAILALLMVFLLAPFLIILIASFGDNASLRFPPQGFTLTWFAEVLDQRMFVRGFYLSVHVAVASTLLSLLLGVPLAYATSRYTFTGKRIIQVVATLPVIVPELVLGLALLRYLIVVTDLPLRPSLILGHTTLLIPYTVRITLASLSNLPYDIEQAAISLGASRLGTFFKIVMPNIRDGGLTSFVLAFILSFNNVPVSLFLTGIGVATLPIQMLLYMEYNFDPSIAALSTLLIIFSTLVVFITERLLGISRAFK
jgi:putative spermidine/putrescine transport system permease protein